MKTSMYAFLGMALICAGLPVVCKASGSDSLDTLLENIDKEESNVKLVYEYECDITDDYVVPEVIFSNGEDVYGLELYGTMDDGHYRIDDGRVIRKKNVRTTAVRALMLELARDVYRETGQKNDVKIALETAALLGITKEDKYNSDTQYCYVGPLQLCMLEAARNLQFREGSRVEDISVPCFYHDLESGEVGLSGEHKGDLYHPAFSYQTEITWKDGLPSHAKCRVDFTLSKDIILKRTKKD